MPYHQPIRYEFHISRQSRDFYQFDLSIFSFNGNAIFANFHAARIFAQKMNAHRDLLSFPERAVRAGQVNAMGLIDEILHLVVEHYRQQRTPQVMANALAWLYERIGQERVDNALAQFADQFPTISVYRREIGLGDYLKGESLRLEGERVPNRQIAQEEMLMLWLANMNPAFSPFMELFDDSALEKGSAYPTMLASLYEFFDTQPTFGPDGQNLIDMLRAPALASPHSLSGQLEYIRTRWGGLLGDFLYRLLSSLDLIKEEEKAIFIGPGPSIVYDFSAILDEPERFSPDKDWMPNLVLIAKNSYVWLDQLSKKYGRSITRLDQIPDEELDNLSSWGFSGLWLIGLWERSMASRNIKQMRGNLEAVASAYSLFSYDIAEDLGGEEAFQDLRKRAWQRSIRLASDMVPNHMGIDSRWLIEHPDWFISLDFSPFPSYTFNGPNLSWDNRVGIYLEDHYYDNTDAAVVFKRVDFWSGVEKYIYHGNDGTSMPWNDTAQLNYLIPEVREAVIQTILHVARKFPIIRFDAAMTLAKRHYQRLWFPEPGSGGDIPSRAEYGMTKAAFDQAFPQEFWREVVDRVAQELPDTLLLAEAFWLMEGYFVRTLGMHRVYNSAFMNMLRDEKNQEYRLVIKNTLEFDPEILKRYVNFMNNPDERTAVDQFGKDDKYFGVAAMMATMPGLPMFGHGQIEGYTEKYGMEYKRAYYDETPDQYLVERHQREIFPLLRQRYLFADVREFLLYDFYSPEGYVNEDVIAYSNRAGDQRTLVIYHNKFASARGWIRRSAAYSVKTGQGDERILFQKTLGEGLGLNDDGGVYTIFRDHISGLEFIRNSQELCQGGLYVELEAYKYQVFLDFREVHDNEWGQYAHLAAFLEGRGVPNIEEALKEIFLQPVLTPFRELVNPGSIAWLVDHRAPISTRVARLETLSQALDEAETKLQTLISEVGALVGAKDDFAALAAELRQELEAILDLPAVERQLPAKDKVTKAALAYLHAGPDGKSPLNEGDLPTWSVFLSWSFVHKLGMVLKTQDVKIVETLKEPVPSDAIVAQGFDYAEQSRTWIDELLFGKIIANTLQEMGVQAEAAWQQVNLIRFLVSHHNWCESQDEKTAAAYQILRDWLQDDAVQRFLHIHRYQGVLWFNKEAFEALCWWAFALSVVRCCGLGDDVERPMSGSEIILACYWVVNELLEAAEKSGYQVERLLEVVRL